MGIDSEWIVGRKEIMAALHTDTWMTVRRWKKEYGLKFVVWPNGSPAIMRKHLNEFILKASKLSQNKHTIAARHLAEAREILRNHDARRRTPNSR